MILLIDAPASDPRLARRGAVVDPPDKPAGGGPPQTPGLARRKAAVDPQTNSPAHPTDNYSFNHLFDNY